jgi:biopolymer transport protein ExbD
MIRFSCTNCGKHLRLDERFAGRSVKCPRCGTDLISPRSLAEHMAGPPSAQGIIEDDDHEGPLFLSKHKEAEEQIDMTAMVDIVFFLLIFFLVTSVQSIQASLEMPAPDPEEGSTKGRVTVEAMEQSSDYIVARIDKDNTVWINESEAPTRQETIAKLRDAREEGGNTLVVMASGDCRHETVVMVLDAGAAAGLDDVRLANLGDE